MHMLIPYQIKRSNRRKTISLQVKENEVVINAPKHCSERFLLELLKNKHHWIEYQQSKLQHAKEVVSQKTVTPGATLSYLGKSYSVKIDITPTSGVSLEGDNLVVHTPIETQAHEVLMHWYREQAYEILLQKSLIAAAHVSRSFNKLRVSQYKSKWGSCSVAGDLKYNWLLIQAPESIINYVVAHEVSHLVEANHQPEFWKTVAHLCPHYIESRAWLKAHGCLLHWPE